MNLTKFANYEIKKSDLYARAKRAGANCSLYNSFKGVYLPCNGRVSQLYLYFSKNFVPVVCNILQAIDIFEEVRELTNTEFDYIIPILELIAIEQNKLYMLPKIRSIKIPITKNQLHTTLLKCSNEYRISHFKTRDKYRYRITKVAERNRTNAIYLAKSVTFSMLNTMYERNTRNRYYIPIILLLPLLVLPKKYSFAYYIPLYNIIKPIITKLFLTGVEISNADRIYMDTVKAEYKTVVVLSTIVPSQDKLDILRSRICDTLATLPIGEVGLVVLADLKQSDLELECNDIILVQQLKNMIVDIGDSRIALMVRERSYSVTQGAYIGKNRKRGAISDLVSIIKGNYVATIELYLPFNVYDTKYMVLLDIDTKPTLGSIKELIMAIAHPNNDAGVIVPRTAFELNSSDNFCGILCGNGGLSSYNSGINELYEDLFSSGIFCGKGIVDINKYYEMIPRLQSEWLLSHDIVEGILLHTKYASDIIFFDNFPETVDGYFKRMHRWIRGDVQNSSFIFNKEIDFVERFKLIDNILRALMPITRVVSIVISMYYGKALQLFMLLFFKSIVELAELFFSGKFNRQYYSKRSLVWDVFSRQILEIILLPKEAIVATDAIIRGLYRRYISKKRTLDWVTAAQYDAKLNNGIIEKIESLYLKEFVEEKDMEIGIGKREILLEYATKMLNYYSDFVLEYDNSLPPDNVQLEPKYKVAHRTSPTNIGLMLLSFLSGYDLKIMTLTELISKVDNTLKTVEKLKKYKGHLYNWYDTMTLEVLKPRIISTVDSGNLVCCLTALREGLSEISDFSINSIIKRIDTIIDSTDFKFLYDKGKNLFSISFNYDTSELSSSHYDMLMSEARMTGYFCIAKGFAPVKHWSALSREMSFVNGKGGCRSWTGTCFEYFMPELLLKSEKASLCYESLMHCIICQKRRVSDTPYGISESGYAVVKDNSYQYKAHGVQELALKKDMDLELVISPYSTYLMLPFDMDNALDNLNRLTKLGCMGEYGHFEAIDYTSCDESSVVFSYMAHHLGMSIVAINNAINDGIMQKRFMRNKEMHRVKELLAERIDDYKKSDSIVVDMQTTIPLDPFMPKVKILDNGAITSVLSDTGISYIKSQGNCITRKTSDTISSPIGIFCYIDRVSMTYAPHYSNVANYSSEIGENNVLYEYNDEQVSCEINVSLHKSVGIERREIMIRNMTLVPKEYELIVYIEPALYSYADDKAHLTFSKLFVGIENDTENKVVTAVRRKRGNEVITHLAVGFKEDIEYNLIANRDDIYERGYTIKDTLVEADSTHYCAKGAPDPCIALRTIVAVAVGQEKKLTLYISTAVQKNNAIKQLEVARTDFMSNDNNNDVDLKSEQDLFPSEDGEYTPIIINTIMPRYFNITADYSIIGGDFIGKSFHIKGKPTLPWCNILANRTFGTLVSDRALGYTYAINSRECKLSPWRNDPIVDNNGERLLLKDKAYYDLIDGAAVEYSPSFAKYRGTVKDIETTVKVSVPKKGMIKYIDITLKNTGDENEVELYYYLEPILGVDKDGSEVIIECADNILYATNLKNPYFSNFLGMTANCTVEMITSKKAFFCGRMGKANSCCAIKVTKLLKAGESSEIRFILCFSKSKLGISKLIKLSPSEALWNYSADKIDSGDKANDLLLNVWLPHQVRSSRIFARTSFYQCSGAYGFRDQLQDVTSMLRLYPNIAKTHIYRCCAAQFEEGDVLHWWHIMHSNDKKGVRTRCSDDLFWLPYAVAQYIKYTGDSSILDVKIKLLQAPILSKDEHDRYLNAEYTNYAISVYEHCKRAIECGYKLGDNGLIKMGDSDWNDAYSNVGIKGEGESVWLSQFVAIVLRKFSKVCIQKDEQDIACEYQKKATQLLLMVDNSSYEIDHYIRAFYDNGRKMGSYENDECRLDILPQAFSVLSNMPNKYRVIKAIDSAYSHLVDEKYGIVRLFEGSFDKSTQNPGYVKAYPVGVRENGGQYTHAAVWFAMALKKMHDKRSCDILAMINPIKRYNDVHRAKAYRVEPYFVCADIYTNPYCYGRGGFSMYTGAAGWLYRALCEEIDEMRS